MLKLVAAQRVTRHHHVYSQGGCHHGSTLAGIRVMAMYSVQLAGRVVLCQLHQGVLAVGNAPVSKLPQVRPQILLPGQKAALLLSGPRNFFLRYTVLLRRFSSYFEEARRSQSLQKEQNHAVLHLWKVGIRLHLAAKHGDQLARNSLQVRCSWSIQSSAHNFPAKSSVP